MPSCLEFRRVRSEEHTSELQSHDNLVCRLLLEKKKSHVRRPGRLGAHLRDAPRGLSRDARAAPELPAAQLLEGRDIARDRAPPSIFFNDPGPTEDTILQLHVHTAV